ncbi:hypothetical protein RUM44_008433 [Polyplax serrata]|uniref:Uncharacterized protein n=1 Tax=Polyplax serrata TaxID=468196 RepID=A0ABR1BCB4_POLSC
MIKEEQTIEWKDIGDEEDDDEDAGKGDVKPEVTPVKKSTGNQISLSCWDYSIELEYLKDPEGKCHTNAFFKKINKIRMDSLCSHPGLGGPK